jgi:acetate---CoA ligase (ADP-forming)
MITMARVSKILHPQSVAIIGASRKKGSLGNVFLQAVIRMKYKGEIYPINPKADEIDGYKTYPDLKSLPVKPDLAVILLPGNQVAGSLREAGEAGIRHVIVISAGFREIGAEGAQKELELLEIVRKYGMNMLGPNCMGVFNTAKSVSFNGTFSPTLPKPGHVAFISQSGALGVAVLELAENKDLGFSIFVSTGNKADISDNDILEHLKSDSNTKVITLYQEDIHKPNIFRKITRNIVSKKPILTVKSGRTESGLKAASSHTGALASPDNLTDGFLKQCGVIRMDTLEEMFDAARALDNQPLPEGPRVAILTNAGGPAILASDALEKNDLKLASLSIKTIKTLKALLPEEAAVDNPVDMIASATHETYFKALELILADDQVDAVIVIIVKPPVNTDPEKIVNQLDALVHNCGKTIIPVLMARHDENSGVKKFAELHLPLFDYPESAVKSLGVMWRYHEIQQRFRKSEAIVITPKLEYQLKPGDGTDNYQVPLNEIGNLLNEYDIKTVNSLITDDLNELLKFQKENHRIVLKIGNEQILHKTEAGMVKMNLDNSDMVKSVYQKMMTMSRLKLPEQIQPFFLAQKQLAGGVELVLGGKRDLIFGPVVMVGIGGIFIEVLKDVVFRVAPVNFYEAKEMLEDLRSQVLLDGFRGSPAVDRNRIAYSIQQFSILFAEHPEIVEMDLNPMIWSTEEQRAVVVDMRATVQ